MLQVMLSKLIFQLLFRETTQSSFGFNNLEQPHSGFEACIN